ncbi:MAG: hypothetical protein ACTSYM_05600 [Candidatus Baldrarchaeia archaeon]
MSDKLEKFLKALERESKFDSSILKLFKPTRLDMFEAFYQPEKMEEIGRRLPKGVLKEPWPKNICLYIETCLAHGGFSVSFYPFRINNSYFCQARCLQRQPAEEKYGNVPSMIFEIPREMYSYMRSKVGEWREIWYNICKGGEILKESGESGER